MCQQVRPGDSGPQGEIVGRVRMYETVSTIAFGGRRRRVYGRIVALSGATVGTAQQLGVPDGSFDVVTSTLAIHHIPEPERPAAFAEMYRALRPGGRLLVADFRPSRRRFALHSGGRTMRHSAPALIGDLAAATGFRVEKYGDLPLLRYFQAVRPDDEGA